MKRQLTLCRWCFNLNLRRRTDPELFPETSDFLSVVLQFQPRPATLSDSRDHSVLLSELQMKTRSRSDLVFNFTRLVSSLEAQFHSKLKLSWVKRRCWSAVVATVAGSLIERTHILDEWRGRSFIETIEEIESFRNQFQAGSLS